MQKLIKYMLGILIYFPAWLVISSILFVTISYFIDRNHPEVMKNYQGVDYFAWSFMLMPVYVPSILYLYLLPIFLLHVILIDLIITQSKVSNFYPFLTNLTIGSAEFICIYFLFRHQESLPANSPYVVAYATAALIASLGCGYLIGAFLRWYPR